MALIEVEGVHKSYVVGDQRIRALDGIDLEMRSGEFSAVTGPSGSGKSTLMHLLGCLDIPDGGRISLDGIDVSRAGSDRLSAIRNEKIGFVFQSFNLLGRLDVLKNVELPMLYSRVPARERHERAMEAIVQVGLEERVHNRPMQLSGGQCQRVAIARALVNDPSLILADEPTGNLDSHTGETILNLFHSLHESGRTIVIVTHDDHVAASCQRQIEIFDGKVSRDVSTLPSSA